MKTDETDIRLRLSKLSPEKRELLLRRLTKAREDVDGTEALSLLPILRPAPEERYEPFPLTDVQQAYLIGRRDSMELGGVSAHWYAEYEATDLDLHRLESAVRKVISRHDMLRTVFLPDGRQQTLKEVPP